jgi:hypothetical protein
VEIYPTLFRMESTRSKEKIRSYEALNSALEKLDSAAVPQAGPAIDHETDALISAAGLRWAAGRTSVWGSHDRKSSRHEGWIFGV